MKNAYLKIRMFPLYFQANLKEQFWYFPMEWLTRTRNTTKKTHSF